MSGLCQNLSDSEWDGQYHLAFLSRSGGGRSRLGKWGVWRCSGPALMAPRRPSASQNKVSHASHLPPSRCDKVDSGYYASSGADLGKKGLRQPCRRRGRWWRALRRLRGVGAGRRR